MGSEELAPSLLGKESKHTYTLKNGPVASGHLIYRIHWKKKKKKKDLKSFLTNKTWKTTFHNKIADRHHSFY